MKNLGAAVLALLGALGCGGADRPPVLGDTADASVAGHHARQVDGPTGLPIAAMPLVGLFTVPVRVNGLSGPPMLVDTGAPLTFVDPLAYGSSRDDGTNGTVTLTAGALSLVDVPIVWGDPFGFAPLLGGVLGVNLICQFPSTWDWQRSRFFLGAPPADVEVTGEVARQSFRLEGGGLFRFTTGGVVAVPPTRLVVDVMMESRPLRLILDTGASTTALRDDLVSAFLADGRGSLAVSVGAQGGTMQQRTFRVRRIDALGVSREGALVSGYSATNLANIAAEVGHDIDGLLGADFLRPWLTTLDYPAGELRLQRYRDASHVRDGMTRAGFVLGVTSTGASVISMVAPGSDAAAQGFTAGEMLLSVDGHDATALTHDEADVLLLGAVGETRHVRTNAREADVRVEDLVPLR